MNDQLPVRLILADDHDEVRDRLRRVLAVEPGIRVVDEATDGLGASGQEVVAAVRAVSCGRTFYSQPVQDVLNSSDQAGGPHGVQALTDREREVLRLLVRGQSSREIGCELDISTRTVETHRANLMRKLGVESVALLTQLAIREGLLELPPGV